MKSFFVSTSVACALATAGALRAETPVVLDPVEVNAVKHSLTVSTLSEARVDLARTPGGTEVIDANRYLTGRASTVADTFALSPGVFAQSRFGSDEARLSIRGSGLQRTFHGRGIRALQDGVPLNLADGGFDMQALEPTAAAYINVWRGGNALAYGSATLGGAIDYISRTGRDAPGGFVRLEIGSWDYLRATIAGGITNEKTDVYASFTQQQQDGFRDHADQNNQRLFANAGWRLSDNIETRLYVTAVKTDSELPGSLTKAELESDPTQADNSFFGSVRYDNHRDFELTRIASKTTVRNGDTEWDFSAALTHKDLDHPITPFAGVIDQLSNDLLLGATLTNTSEVFATDNRLRAGILLTRGVTDSATFENNLGARGTLRSIDRQTATNLEGFLEDQLALGRGFTGVAGVSVAHSIREDERLFTNPVANAPFYTPPAPGALLSYDRSYDNVSPKLGVRWDNAARDLQAFANVSGSFEPPSFSETVTANAARKAQTATTVELGTRGVRDFVRWDVTAYHAAIKDELLTIVDPVSLVSTTTNADRTTHTGIELATEIDLLGQSWKQTPANRLVLRTAWTYGLFKFDDDASYGNNTIAGLPPHLIRGELLWENAAGWYAGPTFEWVPVKSYIDHRNTFAADSYALLGFKVGRRLDKGLSWFVEARNLTDETYAATTGVIDNAGGVDQRQFLPGDGRSFYAGVEYRF
ncbi:MAG: TonB-dependent receptor [Opitutaceae bacterium]|jgi:iron complex outermembrane receptor protein